MIAKSSRVRAADFETSWLRNRAKEMGLDPSRLHRKTWELAVIAQAYRDRVAAIRSSETSRRPVKCLGFGVGKELLPLWLYNEGAHVLATDYPGDDPNWSRTNQHANSLADLGFDFDPSTGIDSENRIVDRVSFRPVDMNDIPADLLQGQFDFTWSCGSFEHIGGIQQSLSFFCRQMECLRPGGIACHTTEFNYESKHPDSFSTILRMKLEAGYDPTLDTHNLCLFRRRDIADLSAALWVQGDQLFPPGLDLDRTSPTAHPADTYVDEPPYYQDPDQPYHLNIRIGSTNFKTTSICLIARKGGK